MAEIIEKALMLLSHDLELKGIDLVKEIDPELPLVECDFHQMQQALLNLLSNASHSMSGGGKLHVTAKKPGEGPFIEVTIEDTGSGIPKEDIEHIFEPFFTTKEEGKGVGLGLSVVYGIVTKHGGTIDVESSVGKGTLFRIRLPTE
jgi:signal transduction histidine kinase